jgi:6-phospho-beta-glucosidase
MKVTVIGGGSTYTPELIQGFLQRVSTFPMRELCLMDVEPQRLEIVGGFVQRIVDAWDNPFKVVCTTDRPEAIKGASYVVSQIRVGMMQARKEDEYLGARHGLVGQETTGMGGMAKALRTIPVLLDVADDILSYAPDAFLVNFTNPAGLITEALQTYRPALKSIGVCNVPITAKMTILDGLKALTGKTYDPSKAQLDTLGLNHLSWHRGFSVDGEDVWPDVYEAFLKENEKEQEWNESLLEALHLIPNYYLHYYYNTKHKLAEQKVWPPSRAEEVMQVEEELLTLYQDPALDSVPDALMKRGGAYYSTMATQLLNAIENDSGEIHVVNTRHLGAVPGWPEDWVVELPCVIDKEGAHPIPTDALPTVCNGLVAQVKSYEQLTALAAVTGDKQILYQAMLAHPLGPEADQISVVMEDILRTHRAYLPQFHQRESLS